MPTLAVLDLLAQLPETTIYVHTVKLVAMVALFAIWAQFAQWVDKDTIVVNTYRVVWNLITMGCGIAATLLMLFLPMFLVGALAFVVIVGAVMTTYIVHRNGLVEEQDHVGTPAHIIGVIQRTFSGKKKQQVEDVKERVRITAADKKVVQIPEEEFERHQFRLTQDLLFDALWRRASLVEVAPAGQTSKATYLIDGLPSEREALERVEGDALLRYFKKLAGLSIEERRKPQEGRITIAMGGSKDRQGVVVRTGGSTAGEKLVLRILGAETRYKVADVGFTEQQLAVVRQIMEAPRGLILLSAPRISGLTTTVYTFTRSHDAFLQNIQTLEYKKELDIDNVTQRIYEPSDDKTFVSELLKLVRSDPNIVVLPEIRDRDTAVAAANGATTKQKVYVGFVAGDLFEALQKWMALVGDAKLVAKSLLAVVNQRLVRVLCSECKQPYKPDAQTLRKINMPSDKVLYRPPETQYDKHGNPILCQNCQGAGYVGRTGVFNLLVMDEELRKVIRGGGSLRDIQTYALKAGGLGLQQQALQKVFDGITSIPEIVRVTRGSAGGNRAAAKARPRTGGANPAA